MEQLAESIAVIHANVVAIVFGELLSRTKANLGHCRIGGNGSSYYGQADNQGVTNRLFSFSDNNDIKMTLTIQRGLLFLTE